MQAIGQSKMIDSLRNILKTEKNDTDRVRILNALAYSIYTTDPDTTILFAQQALDLSEKLASSPIKLIAEAGKKGEASAYNYEGIGYHVKGNFPKALAFYLTAMKKFSELGNKQGQASVLSNIGVIYQNQSDYSKALDSYSKALELNEITGNKKGQSIDLTNIGYIHIEQGNYPEAMDCDLKALKLDEKIGDKKGLAAVYANLGNIYNDEGNNPKALDFYFKALKLDEENGNKQAQASENSAIGVIYFSMSEYAKSMEYYFKSLKMYDEIGNKLGQADNLGNIGVIYQTQYNYPKALENYFMALKLNNEIGNKYGQANNLGNIGNLYTITGKFKDAEKYLKESITIDSSIGELNNLRQFEEGLSKLYDTTGRYKPSLIWYKKAMIIKDSLFNIDKDKALTRKELTYQYEKKEASEKAKQDKKEAVAEQDKKRQILLRNAFMAGFVLTLALAFFIFRGYRQKQKANVLITEQKEAVEQKNIVIEKQKALVEQQKQLVEEKNQNILDSLTYAKRLQDAILPPLSIIRQYIPESFLLYKPKDIVAGDFYWMEKAGDNVLIAAADCTGHGVPGALVSIVCSNALNRAVKEFHIIEPGKILDKARELVLETFEKSESNVQDGMDISLCCINKKTNEVQWSGAYNSLWYIQNGEIHEVTADKQPIGKHDKPQPFNTYNLNLEKGNTLYLFTDGFADQFGGPKGKKFKYRQMEELLLVNATRSMEEQKNALEKTLEDWKGDLEQVDDILVLGIKV